MSTFSDFKKEIQLLDEKIEDYYAPFEEKEGRKIITDGIADLEGYYDSNPKILWILKEAYDEDGGWAMAEIFNNKEYITSKTKGYRTFHPIIYVSYAIHNDYSCWDNMKNISEDPEMATVIQCIAYMNVSKFAGNSTSNNNEISKAYKQHRDILLEQIKVYNPDIIIGGNTIWNFVEDLGLKDIKAGYENDIEFWIKNGKLYIDANHPGQRGNPEKYVDAIVGIVRNNFRK